MGKFTVRRAVLSGVVTGSTLAAALLAPAHAGSPATRPTGPAATTSPAGAAAPGIYMVWGNSTDAAQPWVRGGQVKVEWRDIEPARGSFNWAPLAAGLATYANLGKSTTIQVNADTKPAWVWNLVAKCGTSKGWDIPQYWDPIYLTLEQEMITSLKNYLATAPNTDRITLVRANADAIGTELTDVPTGYRCTPTPDGHVYNVVWDKTVARTWYQKIMGAWLNTLSPTFHVALRVQTFTTNNPPPPLDWLGVDKAWIMGTASDIDPNPSRENFDIFSMNWARTGKTVAYWEHQRADGVKTNLVSWNYWRLLLELQKGVTYPAVYGNVLRYANTNPEFRAAFDFTNRYAGFHNSPATAPGAWVALRQGTGVRAGNFGWFITQLNPDTTSTALDSNSGASMIGNPTQRFGRFARRIDGGTTKDTMFFQLNPAFRSSIAIPTGLTELHVRYLDKGIGSFVVNYGAGLSGVVAKTDTGDWKDAVIDVPGAAFTGSLPGGSDVTVQALGTESTVFHMVELVVKSR
jgi:hypothetical protein